MPAGNWTDLAASIATAVRGCAYIVCVIAIAVVGRLHRSDFAKPPPFTLHALPLAVACSAALALRALVEACVACGVGRCPPPRAVPGLVAESSAHVLATFVLLASRGGARNSARLPIASLALGGLATAGFQLLAAGPPRLAPDTWDEVDVWAALVRLPFEALLFLCVCCGAAPRSLPSAAGTAPASSRGFLRWRPREPRSGLLGANGANNLLSTDLLGGDWSRAVRGPSNLSQREEAWHEVRGLRSPCPPPCPSWWHLLYAHSPPPSCVSHPCFAVALIHRRLARSHRRQRSGRRGHRHRC